MNGGALRLRQPARRRPYVVALYLLALLREFRWTLLALAAALLLGTILYASAPDLAIPGGRVGPGLALYAAWMALLNQPLIAAPQSTSLRWLNAIYPIVGFVLIGEGVVRLALLMISRRQGEKEWMKVIASTYRDHVVLCGLGHLGFRTLQQLIATQTPVVVLEKDGTNRFINDAKSLGVPVLVRDMKDDAALLDAGIREAYAVIIATNDDMANLEVALDSRRLNPDIRVVMRLFDQQIASKISGALDVDEVFSSSTLAAPMVAAMSLETHVLSSVVIAGVPHVTGELKVRPGSPLANRRIDELETGYAMRVLARTPIAGPTQSPPSPATTVLEEDTLVLHTTADQLATLATAARGPLAKGTGRSLTTTRS